MAEISKQDDRTLRGYTQIGISLIHQHTGYKGDHDNEMLADVVTALVKATERYEDHKSEWECSLEEHRAKQAKYAIMNLRRSRKRHNGGSVFKLVDNHQIGGEAWKVDLYDELESFPELTQEILRYRYLHDMTLKEVAKEVKVSHETVRRILGDFNE